jgi:hypothetical protein
MEMDIGSYVRWVCKLKLSCCHSCHFLGAWMLFLEGGWCVLARKS